ncbi:MAG: GreA/GreB family elongation factor [Kofleriaceae bacterium]
MIAPGKPALRDELLAILQEALSTAQRSHAAAIDGATNEESRAENEKDTRGLEQSYLARGQAKRVAELEAAISELEAWVVRSFTAHDRIAISALVTIDEDGAVQRLFLAPHGGGSVLSGATHVVSPSSPLGRALLGKRIDDEVELELPGRARAFTITSIE